MRIKKTVCLSFVTCAVSVFAQTDARVAYQQRQAVQEVQRLSSQFDQLQNGMESLASRMNRLESNSSVGDVKAEIAALKSDLSAIKRRQDEMRGEIIAEISKKMADLMAKSRPSATPSASVSAGRGRGRSQPRQSGDDVGGSGPTGPYFEHTIEPGETLSYIAKECKTTVKKIKQYNNMKGDTLRVGQVIKIPAEGEN